jgi:hypothetical protein
MGVVSSADNGFLLLGKYDLTNVSTKLEAEVTDPTVEMTPFGAAVSTYGKPGVKTYAITGHDGWYSDTTASIHDAMTALAAGEHVFMFASSGNTAPATGVAKLCIAGAGALKTSFKRSMSVGDYTKAALSVTMSGKVDDALLIAPLTARGVTGTTAASYANFGADGAAGGRMYLSLPVISWGTRTTLDIVLQDCNTSGGAYADHTAFTQILVATTPTGSGTSEAKVLDHAAIEQYTCVTWTWGGGVAGAETTTFAVAAKAD